MHDISRYLPKYYIPDGVNCTRRQISRSMPSRGFNNSVRDLPSVRPQLLRCNREICTQRDPIIAFALKRFSPAVYRKIHATFSSLYCEFPLILNTISFRDCRFIFTGERGGGELDFQIDREFAIAGTRRLPARAVSSAKRLAPSPLPSSPQISTIKAIRRSKAVGSFNREIEGETKCTAHHV